MNINTENLKLQHVPILQQWAGRTSGAMTPNDFPRVKEQIQQWLEHNTDDAERLDCLIFVYDTPVGIAGLFHDNTAPESAELYMLLCEVGYNLIRTATYATLCMLDRAFQEYGFQTVYASVYTCHPEYLEVLERMGFNRQTEKGEVIMVEVERKAFFSRKYLF